MTKNKVELGDLVKDSIHGFKGIAVQRVFYLYGCSRIAIQPSVDKDGKMRDAAWFDEPSVIVIKKQVVKPDQQKIKELGTGGHCDRIPERSNPR